MPKRSIETHLLHLLQFCYSSIDKGLQDDVIYTEFCAAFDKVNHYILLAKLLKYGAHSKLLAWLESYPMNRCINVKIWTTFLDPFCNFSGVPQGSILGPLLFIIFINDIVLAVSNVNALLYADDLKMFLAIENSNHCEILQDSVNHFLTWCHDNEMFVNVQKCNLHYFP